MIILKKKTWVIIVRNCPIINYLLKNDELFYVNWHFFFVILENQHDNDKISLLDDYPQANIMGFCKTSA